MNESDIRDKLKNQATKYRITDRRPGELQVYIEYAGCDKWAIHDGFIQTCFSKKDGKFILQHLPSSRTDEFLADTRFKLEEAEKLAQKAIKVQDAQIQAMLKAWKKASPRD